MTRAEIEAIQRLLSRATPAPWWAQREYDGGRTVCSMRHQTDTVCINKAAHVESNPWDAVWDNANLIQELRNNADALLTLAKEALQSRETLAKARGILFSSGASWNDGTQSPWWAVVKRYRTGGHTIIAGPFFSRSRAEEHYEARKHEYGKAVVYCFSGHYSQHYRDLRRVLEEVRDAK